VHLTATSDESSLKIDLDELEILDTVEDPSLKLIIDEIDNVEETVDVVDVAGPRYDCAYSKQTSFQSFS
jgi:ribose 5-phosphate isomerase